jgi:hypothetical protein
LKRASSSPSDKPVHQVLSASGRGEGRFRVRRHQPATKIEAAEIYCVE